MPRLRFAFAPMTVLALVAQLMIAAPGGAADTSVRASDIEAIRAAGEARDEAWAALDVAGRAAPYSQDAVLMAETSPSVVGAAAIRSFLNGYVRLLRENDCVPSISREVRIDVSVDLGYRSGAYTVKQKSGATADTGKWLEIWLRKDGRWQLIREMWTSDGLPLFLPEDLLRAGQAPKEGAT